MAPFSIPAPCIIPLRLPIFGGPKTIDSDTKIQFLCETQIQHEIYYTLDGTKPQPYAGIVQGNKTIKYNSPICLPVGKQTIKAIAINPNIHSMYSNIITKSYEVLKGDTQNIIHTSNMKHSKKVKKKCKDSSKEEIYCIDRELKTPADPRFDSSSVDGTNHLEEAFIAGSDFEVVDSDPEDSVENEDALAFAAIDYKINDDSNEESENSELSDIADKTIDAKLNEDDCVSERPQHEEEEMVEQNLVFSNSTANNNETQFCCVKCDMTLQHCSSCNQMNAVSSKFCIQCGKKLVQICLFCKELNPSIATYCQYCGKKLGSTDVQIETSIKVDHSVMAKPKFKDICTQRVPALFDKETQTVPDRSPVKKNLPRFPMKPISRHSPGRGYWHQQLDYICNHLKSHAYNHLEFRKEISEPTLCDFKSAQISKDENNITVTIVFSPFVTEKNGESDDIKSKD